LFSPCHGAVRRAKFAFSFCVCFHFIFQPKKLALVVFLAPSLLRGEFLQGSLFLFGALVRVSAAVRVVVFVLLGVHDKCFGVRCWVAPVFFEFIDAPRARPSTFFFALACLLCVVVRLRGRLAVARGLGVVCEGVCVLCGGFCVVVWCRARVGFGVGGGGFFREVCFYCVRKCR
jgi:hypothetical protein